MNILVKVIPSASSSMVEERIPGLVLHAFDELVKL
jgi:hypothetical protein